MSNTQPPSNPPYGENPYGNGQDSSQNSHGDWHHSSQEPYRDWQGWGQDRNNGPRDPREKIPPYQAPPPSWDQKTKPYYGPKHEPGPSLYEQVTSNAPSEPRHAIGAAILGFLLGVFGAQNFYVGRYKLALIQLGITLISGFNLAPAVGIWGIIEGFMFLNGNSERYRKDAWGRDLVR